VVEDSQERGHGPAGLTARPLCLRRRHCAKADVGDRWLEIEIPIPTTGSLADETAKPFREYYTALASARTVLGDYLRQSGEHHFFVSGAETPEPELQAAAAADDLEGQTPGS
jgi:hypothetical protein